MGDFPSATNNTAQSPSRLADTTKYEWELVTTVAAMRMVYVEPAGFDDDCFIADVLAEVYRTRETGRAVQIWFFDSKAHTPRRGVMESREQRHFRAKYGHNPRNGHESFEWAVREDPTAPRQWTLEEALIGPGRCD